MQIRDWMNENQPIVAGVVILVLILAFAKITCTLTDSGSSRGPQRLRCGPALMRGQCMCVSSYVA